jgi:hypothetical protein
MCAKNCLNRLQILAKNLDSEPDGVPNDHIHADKRGLDLYMQCVCVEFQEKEKNAFHPLTRYQITSFYLIKRLL